ncbi:hypothetical protein C5167_020338 [Papaver somniferum]|uniref:Protein kinase domain-containing protein n=1 Tax=Papaver somniferum TaxID=3469 RepID=A0A4Y7IWY6_PAPSO|nr:hypothetical protein C5167_020338 [Papaver somniferum]
MGRCLPCFGSSDEKKHHQSGETKKEFVKDGSKTEQSNHISRVSSEKKSRGGSDSKKETPVPKDGPTAPIAAQTFTFRELAAATKNFRPESLLGEGGFGRVYKGRLESTGQVSVESYVPPDKEALDWNTRMKIAAGAAKGLEYLHDKANPPVIYRDFKSSNILLDEGFHPKLSDFGLAKLGPVGDKTHVSTRVMGTYGYCAPEYAMTGQLTLKSDVYSFGVVFLELITGRKAIDQTRLQGEQNLVAWARPLFKDRRKFPKMADPLLQGRYPMRGLYQALAVAAMCLQEQATTRPLIGDVVTALSYLASQTYDPNAVQNNRGGSSRDKEDRKSHADLSDSQKNSPRYQDSPGSRRRDPAQQGMNFGPEVGRGESGSSGRKWGLEEFDRQESQKNSPAHGGKTPRSSSRGPDRERAVQEAKVWGENWRERKRTDPNGSFDRTNE